MLGIMLWQDTGAQSRQVTIYRMELVAAAAQAPLMWTDVRLPEQRANQAVAGLALGLAWAGLACGAVSRGAAPPRAAALERLF